MKLTKDYIAEHIKRTKFYYWTLYALQNYKRVHIMSYNADDITESDSDEEKAQKAINRLFAVLQDFPKDAVLSIELKSSKNANGNGIIGGIEFVNKTKEETEEQPQNFNGFSGFVNPPAGWVSESVLNGKLEELRAENSRQINEIMFKQREKDFAEKMHRERAELEEMRRELKDEKKKYESNTGAAAETLVFAIKKILGELFPGLKMLKTTPETTPPQLAGIKEEPEPTDPKYKAVEKLAGILYENPKITASQVENLINTMQTKPQPTAEPGKEADVK
jgi:hypothetical protein